MSVRGLAALVGDDVVAKLLQANVWTVEKVVASDPDALRSCTGITPQESALLQQAVLQLHCAPAVNALDLKDVLDARSVIMSTGCAGLDSLLGGGVYTDEVLEIVGPSACGKTQLCHSILHSVVACSPATAMFFDCQQTFSPVRLRAMHVAFREGDPNSGVGLCSFGADVEESAQHVLSKVGVVHSETVFDLLDQLWKLHAQLDAAQPPPSLACLRLVVVDCVATLLAPILGPKPRGHALMMQIGRLLKRIAAEHHIAVVVTNNVRANGHPALGDSWSSVCHHRVLVTNPRPAAATPNKSLFLSALKSTRQAKGQVVQVHLTARGMV